MNKIFEQWLEERGIFDEFIEEFHRSCLGIGLGEHLRITPPEYFIISAFHWSQFNDRMEYWRGINKEWRKFLESIG